MPPSLTTLPNLMTIARIVLILPVVVLMLIPQEWAAWAALVLFILAAITDWLDGYLARRSKQISLFGVCFDPIADKLLISAVLVVMLSTDRLTAWGFLPALLIMLREVAVSGLREFLAMMGNTMPVIRLAKWKTATQMVALALLILSDPRVPNAPPAWPGDIALWLAAVLSLVSGWDYLRGAMPHLTSTSNSSTSVRR
ncbi:MAG: CDP-diacylglycerol--glycerol-3-phosphate 3-phosphatidyltransferase [Alphaproteobacteria bacterium]|nr:MAG: CDP-diacylglycerol--glycerol-3-phosphate 3-phosphatidyltransferase [Alphaproteobacteria bacterium]